MLLTQDDRITEILIIINASNLQLNTVIEMEASSHLQVFTIFLKDKRKGFFQTLVSLEKYGEVSVSCLQAFLHVKHPLRQIITFNSLPPVLGVANEAVKLCSLQLRHSRLHLQEYTHIVLKS